nr:hypothetical protein [Micromonospora sp. DSM 115978]
MSATEETTADVILFSRAARPAMLSGNEFVGRRHRIDMTVLALRIRR